MSKKKNNVNIREIYNDNNKSKNIDISTNENNLKKKFSFKNFFKLHEIPEDTNKTKSSKNILKKIIFVIIGIILSFIAGLVICFIVNKDEIIVDMLCSNYGVKVGESNRIISSSIMNIEGKSEGEEFNEIYTLISKLGDNYYYTYQSQTSDFQGFDFSEFYADDNWFYVKKDNQWCKFKFNEFFGANAKLFMLYEMYFSVHLAEGYELKKDNNYYYIEQDISLDIFMNFLGQDITEDTVMKSFLEKVKNETDESFKVHNTYKFNKNDYSLVSVEFSFSEPLKIDEDNYISINLSVEYGIGTSSDFIIPNKIIDSAVELNVAEEFNFDSTEEKEQENLESSTYSEEKQ